MHFFPIACGSELPAPLCPFLLSPLKSLWLFSVQSTLSSAECPLEGGPSRPLAPGYWNHSSRCNWWGKWRAAARKKEFYTTELLCSMIMTSDLPTFPSFSSLLFPPFSFLPCYHAVYSGFIIGSHFWFVFFSHTTYSHSRPSTIPLEEGDICDENYEYLLPPRHKNFTGSFPCRKWKCVELSMSLSLQWGLVLEALMDFGVFFSVRRQQATGKSLLSVCLPFQGWPCVFFI